MAPNFSFKTSLLYERKGFTAETIDTVIIGMPIVTRDFTATFDCLTLPVLLSYSTNGTVRFYVNGGAYFGFLLSNTFTLGEFGDYPEQTIDVKEDTKTFDFGLSFGFGLFVPVGERFAFDFGLRDNLGLIDTFKTDHIVKARFNTIGLVFSLKYFL